MRLAERLAPYIARRQRLALLSPRESDVLGFLCRGLRNHEIAEELQIAPATVSKHVESILRKTGTRTRTEAAVWALRGPQT